MGGLFCKSPLFCMGLVGFATYLKLGTSRYPPTEISDYSSQALPSLASSATEATGPQVPAG